MRGALAAMDDAALTACRELTSIAASLVVALAVLAEPGAAEPLFDAANLEEDWQAGLWGKDAEAAARRARRLAAFLAAARFAGLAARA